MEKIALLTIEMAERIGNVSIKFAEEKNWYVCVAVCDPGGHLLWLRRSHDVPAISSHIAINKAKTSALGRRPTQIYEDQINSGRYALLSAPEVQGLMEGGLPIIFDGKCIGAIGVSNLKPSEDALVAKAGIEYFNNL